MKKKGYGAVIILHNVRSTHNVGAIFRTADAAGVDKVFLCGYTPTPVDAYGRDRKDIAKTALGAEKTIPWEYHKQPSRLIRQLQAAGYTVIAIEQDKGAIDYKQIKDTVQNTPIAFVFGNEVRGVSKQIRSLCDYVAEIPMRGKKESLNVSTSVGIVLFRTLDK